MLYSAKPSVRCFSGAQAHPVENQKGGANCSGNVSLAFLVSKIILPVVESEIQVYMGRRSQRLHTVSRSFGLHSANGNGNLTKCDMVKAIPRNTKRRWDMAEAEWENAHPYSSVALHDSRYLASSCKLTSHARNSSIKPPMITRRDPCTLKKGCRAS